MKRLLEILKYILEDKGVLLIPILGALFGSMAFIVVKEKSSLQLEQKDLLALVSVGSTFLLVLMTRYLTGGRSTSDYRFEIERDLLRREVRFSERQAIGLTEETRKELVESLRARIASDATTQFLDEIRTQVKSDAFSSRLVERSHKTLARIYSEIDALGRRGTINLVLGVTTAIAGVTALSMFVIFDSKDHSSLESFSIAFLPRLSIVVIIEVFSYFFLRLYKASLTEIKYFQNEATNIEYNFVALETALHLSDPKLIESVLARFTHVDRNPILSKDQTTREQKSEELEAATLKLTPEHLLDILRTLSPKKPDGDAKQ